MKRLVITILALAIGVGLGCTRTVPVAPSEDPGANDDDGGGDDRANPVVKAARPDTEAVLNDLLTGKLDNDPDYSPVAQRMKGYKSYAIRAERLCEDLPHAIRYAVNLHGPSGKAYWTFTMTRQNDGKWLLSSANTLSQR